MFLAAGSVDVFFFGLARDSEADVEALARTEVGLEPCRLGERSDEGI
jgi:hypothetical protein